MRVSRASMILSLGRIGPFIRGGISCIRRRFSSRRVVHERYTRSNVCCAIGSLLLPFHHKKLQYLARQEKGKVAIRSSSRECATQLLRSALQLLSALRRRLSDWRLRLQPYGSWLASPTTD